MHFPLLLSVAFIGLLSFKSPKNPAASNLSQPHKNSDTLFWSPDIQLTWADFKAKSATLKGKGYAAYTFTIIILDYELKSTGGNFNPEFRVKCAFQKSKSWVNRKDPSCKTPEILAHEQLHFTIAEITARKLRRNLKSMQYSKNYKNEIRQIYNKTINEGEQMQDKYDKESNHGIIEEAQERWSFLVNSDLGYLTNYQAN